MSTLGILLTVYIVSALIMLTLMAYGCVNDLIDLSDAGIWLKVSVVPAFNTLAAAACVLMLAMSLIKRGENEH